MYAYGIINYCFTIKCECEVSFLLFCAYVQSLVFGSVYICFIFVYWTLWEWNVLTDTNKIIIIMWCIINKTWTTTAKNLFVFKFTMSNEQAFLTQKRGLLTHSYKKFTRWELSSFPLCIYNAWTALQNRHH